MLVCKSASAKGTLKKGKGLAGKNIGTITSSAFNKCTGPLNLSFKVKQSGTWDLTVTKYNSKTRRDHRLHQQHQGHPVRYRLLGDRDRLHRRYLHQQDR